MSEPSSGPSTFRLNPNAKPFTFQAMVQNKQNRNGGDAELVVGVFPSAPPMRHDYRYGHYAYPLGEAHSEGATGEDHQRYSWHGAAASQTNTTSAMQYRHEPPPQYPPFHPGENIYHGLATPQASNSYSSYPTLPPRSTESPLYLPCQHPGENTYGLATPYAAGTYLFPYEYPVLPPGFVEPPPYHPCQYPGENAYGLASPHTPDSSFSYECPTLPLISSAEPPPPCLYCHPGDNTCGLEMPYESNLYVSYPPPFVAQNPPSLPTSQRPFQHLESFATPEGTNPIVTHPTAEREEIGPRVAESEIEEMPAITSSETHSLPEAEAASEETVEEQSARSRDNEDSPLHSNYYAILFDDGDGSDDDHDVDDSSAVLGDGESSGGGGSVGSSSEDSVEDVDDESWDDWAVSLARLRDPTLSQSDVLALPEIEYMESKDEKSAKPPESNQDSAVSENEEESCYVSSCCTSSCAICLDDFEEGEKIRLLPSCGHAFHTDHILPWLTDVRGCCPLCKTRVLVPPGEHTDEREDRLLVDGTASFTLASLGSLLVASELATRRLSAWDRIFLDSEYPYAMYSFASRILGNEDNEIDEPDMYSIASRFFRNAHYEIDEPDIGSPHGRRTRAQRRGQERSRRPRLESRRHQPVQPRRGFQRRMR